MSRLWIEGVTDNTNHSIVYFLCLSVSGEGNNIQLYNVKSHGPGALWSLKPRRKKSEISHMVDQTD